MGGDIRRIGILTGGGDCPGLNAVIRAVVRSATSEFGWQVLGIEDGFEGLIQPGHARWLTADDVRGILPRGGTILGTTNRANPFAYPVPGPAGEKIVDVSLDVLRRIDEHALDALVVIGGDGTLRIAQRFVERGILIVGVPKTIDNDLLATDVTFGFDTALDTATDAIDRLHTTAESHHRIMVVEVMGRDAGWIAITSGIAGGADAILIPEIPFNLDHVCERIAQRRTLGRKFSIVVVAEGAFPFGGQAHYQPSPLSNLPRRLGGIGTIVAEVLMERTGQEARCTVLGHLQRGGQPTPFDRLLGTRFGVAAVRCLAEGRSGRMVALRGDAILDVPLSEAVAQQKLVPTDGELVHVARSLGISLGNSL